MAKAAKKPAAKKAEEPKPAPKKEEFALKRGDGNKVFTGFNPDTDRILFGYGSYADTMTEQPIADDTTFTNEGRTATWHIRADGGDTLITVDADTVRLVGVTPDQLRGWNFRGG